MADTRRHLHLTAIAPAGPALFKLFSVTVTHGFYNARGGLCPDFAAVPTPSTQALMTRFGIRLRTNHAGFSVYLPYAQRDALLAYLFPPAAAGAKGATGWERLTFFLTFNNPQLIGITELALGTVTSTRNLYGSNTESHGAGDTILSPGPHMQDASLHSVVGKNLRLSLPADTRRLVVTDIAGTVVLPAGGDSLKLYSAGTDAQYALVDFGDMPFGRYTLVALDALGDPVSGFPRTVLYTECRPDTLIVLDMLFTRPTPSSPGVYPISPASGGMPAIFDEVDYRLPFEARRTLWRYFVVDQSGGMLHDVRIHGHGARFVRDGDVRLPTGATALVFTSEAPMALSQRGAFDLSLTGWRRDADGHDNPLRMTRLPLAASAPVWPSAAPRLASGVSEIFVYL